MRQIKLIAGKAFTSQCKCLGNRLRLTGVQRQITQCPRAPLGKHLGSDLNDGMKQAAYPPCLIPDRAK